MIEIIYEREPNGVKDMRIFKNEEELQEWLSRQLLLWPDTKILKRSNI